MKRFLALGTAVFMLTFLVADEASARGGARMGGGFGGFRGASIGGFHGSGFRAASIGGWRGGGLGVGRVGWSGARASYAFAGRPGLGIGGWRGAGWRGAGWRGAGVGWAGRPFLRRAAWNRGWGWGGWGWPIAAATGIGLYGYASSNCTEWDGYRWVNVCYSNSYGYWW